MTDSQPPTSEPTYEPCGYHRVGDPTCIALSKMRARDGAAVGLSRWGAQPVGQAAQEAEQDRHELILHTDRLLAALAASQKAADRTPPLDVERLGEALIRLRAMVVKESWPDGWEPVSTPTVAAEYAALAATPEPSNPDPLGAALRVIETTAQQYVDEVGVHWYRASDVASALSVRSQRPNPGTEP